MFARDLDSGLNGEITYSLEENSLFSVNPTSGVIQTKAKLDREEISFLRIKAIATDKGDPPMKSEANLEIIITDINDNSPVFSQDSYNVTINENVTTPLVILKVNAVDSDFGQNGEVRYSIVTSSSVGLFSLDYQTGELTLRNPPGTFFKFSLLCFLGFVK